MTTIVIALVSFAVAFVAGAVLSKVYFNVHRGGDGSSIDVQLNEQRRRYRKRVEALQKVIRRHEQSQDEIRRKLETFKAVTDARRSGTAESSGGELDARDAEEDMNDQIAIRDSEIAALRECIDAEREKKDTDRNQLGLLRIERDELVARIRRLESEHAPSDSDTGNPGNVDNDVVADLRAEMGEMRENLATRDRRVHDLEQQLAESEVRAAELTERLATWNQRVAPLTQKLRQQQELIRRYRTQEADTEGGYDPKGTDSSKAADNLKEIRGIGPALERRLNRHGIRTFQQIANLNDGELEDIARKLAIAPNLVQRDQWVEQARELAAKQAVPA